MTYQPSPFRMKGAGARSRRSTPPHDSQRVSGSAVIRCRTSNVRRHPSHWYSYVGTFLNATWEGSKVSRQRALSVVAVALGLWVAGCATTEEEVQRLHARAAYERGLTHLRENQAALALTALQEAISLDGTVAVYRNALGVLYLQLGRPDMALAEFRKAVELDDGFAEAVMNAGIAQAEMAQWEEAVATYRKAVALPTLPAPNVAYQNLGLALYHLKRYREAEEALRFAIGLDPQMAAAFYNLGLVLAAEGRKDDAKAAFQRVRDMAPQSPFGRAAEERLKALAEGG